MADVRCHEHSRTTGIPEECVPCLKLRLEKAEAALCRARDRVIDALNRNQAPMPACQDVVDALMKGYSPCPHEAEAKRLREVINWAGNSAIDFFYYTNDFNDDYPAFDRGFKEELDRRTNDK